MDTLNIDKNLLSVSEEHFSDGRLNRMRSERASSLALPHSSLLDFYDKQQEECSSIALLPTTVSSIVRRHSSHYYPMLEEKQQQQQQQQQQLQLPTKSEMQQTSAVNVVEQHKYGSSIEASPPPPIPKRTFREKFAWNVCDSVTDVPSTMLACKQQQQQQQQQQLPQQQKLQQGSVFIYPQKSGSNNIIATTVGNDAGVYYVNNAAMHMGGQQLQLQPQQQQQQQQFVDSALSRPSFTEFCANDADGISDDDRMSLENSVFDESLTSTPVKVAAAYNAANKYASHVASSATPINNSFSAKTLAAYNGDLSHIAKRSNRSSSSTVDSTATISSGYGSGHSERFASTTSTTADFRSRFSSVDTQSSLDSSSLAEKPLTDSPMSKVTFKLERAVMNEAMRNFNNNETRAELLTSQQQQLNNNNNNNSLPRPKATTTTAGAAMTMMMPLPAVPARKPYAATPKLSPPNQQQPQLQQRASLQDTNEEQVGVHTDKRVSTSASTTSTASAGSSTLSGSSMSSISAATSNSSAVVLTPTPPPPPQTHATQKRPVPPAPPVRTHNSFDSNTDVGGGNGGGTKPPPPPFAMRSKPNRNKPPPIVYPKLHQRQDSNLSSDSFSISSSPGYNSKCLMDMPLLQSASRINKCNVANRIGAESEAVGMTTSRFALNNGTCAAPTPGKALNYRQDSNISSDSFSLTSSPGYNTKIMEAPLLPSLSAKRLCSMPTPIVLKQKHEPIDELDTNLPMSPLSKGVITPDERLQTIVRFQNGASNTMPLQQPIMSRRKSSNPYITNGRLKFRLFQILINAFALLAIAGGLAAYFNAYPTIKFVNKTIINTVHIENNSSLSKNPAPGTCLPIIVKFCQGPQIPYQYTVFPNYIGHFGQLETQVDLDAYEALVDVRCYELVSLFLCTLFVPKCGATGATVPPCQTLCTETMRRCGFFFDVFGLSLPEYLNCNLFKDFASSEDCVGFDQVREVLTAAANPKCDGFQCDQNRCLPKEYVCDGHLDCMDQADEASCERCNSDEIYCGDDSCISRKHVCDGIVDCPFGQDERNCIRLSERNGDLGKGVLEVYRISQEQWMPACVKNWDRAVSPSAVCSMLGYNSVNATSVITQRTHRPLLASVNVSTDIWKMYAKKHSTIMQEFSNCKPAEDYPIAELTCSNYQCGKVKRGRHKPSRRIIGGSQVNPGTWPFLAAILGGPEKIFYCAGVLISDQWVLTASHCIGNHTVIDLEDWTIQLGVTRRNSFTYTGQKVKVKTVIPHPQYNTAIAHDNDIALFQLSTRVAFHDHLLPVCLPPPSVKKLVPRQMCTVIGWGKREDKDPKSTYEYIVNEVQVPIIRRNQCDEWLDNLTVSEGMICAGFEEGGRDACQGDSGGPLLCPYPGQKDRWFVGGIVSWGIMCAHPKLPGVYANVIKYMPWIQEQIQKHSKPIEEDRIMKYDTHPGGPDILSNMASSPIRHKKPFHHQNRSPMDIDLYDSMEKT